MCGLAGLISLSGVGEAEARGPSVLKALSHRGPDASRTWREGPCALFHTRLRVLDVLPRADQPMDRTRGDRAVIVYNGEIYNFRELRDILIREGWTFETSSDTEVLLAGYLSWGSKVFSKARGMWAAGFWHPQNRQLVLVRDPLGKKPLLYTSGPDWIAFASNVEGLLSLLRQTPSVDRAAIDCYLGHLVVPFEHSVFDGIYKVPPGGIVTWSPGCDVRIERYWRVPERPGAAREATLDEVENLLRVAVRRRLESDVPLGVFLSAGLDSSLIAALMAQESHRPIVAVTAGTAGADDDERLAARTVADMYGLEHRPLEVPPVSAARLPQLIAELGEPFGDSSILPTFAVAEVARREMTVALTGDGGDEAFFGYDTFRGVRLAKTYRRLPALSRRVLRKMTGAGGGTAWGRRLEALCEYGLAPLASSFRNRMGFSEPDRRALLGSNQGDPHHTAEHIYRERLARLGELPDADALRRTFYETYVPNDYLPKVDTATMAASLEARCPFLDVDVVEFALGLPASVAFPRGRAKALLKPLARRLLPRGLVRRPKTGFGIPVGAWLRGPLGPAMEEFVFRRGTFMASLVDPLVARRFMEAHMHGADHSTRLWGLLALGVWCAVVVERRWRPVDPLPVGPRKQGGTE